MRRRRVLQLAASGSLWWVTVACSDSENDGGEPGESDGSGQPSRRPAPPPVEMIRTRWAADPWSLGAYSFLPVGADPGLRRTLAEPIDGRLHFAGEAVAQDAPSTVHGAVESGRRAAANVEAAGPADTVVVVGAGMAGLTVASELRRGGTQVVVVEARDRVGGRLATERPDGWPIPVELGASWVHDTEASSLGEQLADLEVSTVPFDYRGSLLEGDDAAPVERDDWLAPAAEAVELAVAWAEEQDEDRSLADAIDQSGAATDTGVDPIVLATALESEIATEYGASADELSAWWGLAEGTEGDDLLVTGGYDALATALAEDLEVRLSTPVVAIDRSGPDGVVVSLADGEELVADQVVVTVPLGVLQAGSITFEPPLPDDVSAAIDALGMGVLDKYWFRFDERFWPEGSLMWTRVDPPEGAFAEWFDLSEATGEPVLLALLGGPTARAWQDRSDEEVLAAVQPVLNDLAGAAD